MESCYHIRKSKGKTEGTLNFQGSNQVDCDVIRKSEGYDQIKCREIIAKMIIAHELPLIVCRVQTQLKMVSTLITHNLRMTTLVSLLKIKSNSLQKLILRYS
jgi:hypothetical protein